MTARRVVLLAALLAVLGRVGGLVWPLRPDEAGFLLVAQTWAPTADSLYGPHFVDRPPLIIALVKMTDHLAGPLGFRVLAALGCGVAVLLAAALVREVERHLRPAPGESPEETDGLTRIQAGVALMTAALLVTPQIDAIAAKGELLGVPILLGTSLVALRALRTSSVPLAFAAGLCGALAVGLKQSLLGGLLFGTVLLLVEFIRHERKRRRLSLLALAALAGAAVPVVGTVLWSVRAGVDLSTLQYAVLSFRSEASVVIAEHPSAANLARSRSLFLHALACGLAFLTALGLLGIPRAVRHLPGPVVAAAATVILDLAVVGLSGSFWPSYLFTLVPSSIVLWACVRVSAAHAPPGSFSARWSPRLAIAVGAYCLASASILLAGWFAAIWYFGDPPAEVANGTAIARASGPDDTLVVYGGRADLQYTSGLPSPYAHLWSLPMRTMDPELTDLRDLLESPDAPTWFAVAASLDAWDGLGATALTDVLSTRYVRVEDACQPVKLYRLSSARPVPEFAPGCSTPWGQR